MKKFLTPFLFCLIFSNCCFAETIWADDSVNELIIKQYDANALRDEYLPALPDSLKQKNTSKVESNQKTNEKLEEKQPFDSDITKKHSVPTIDSQVNPVKPKTIDKTALVKKGTKFKLRIEQAIDDSAYVGEKIKFTSLYPESNKYITIPAGTKFIGTVQDSHLPQISANGGLLVISIDEFIYQGRSYPIESKVIKVGAKRIYQNNIKGKHTYWKGVANAVKPGVKFYKKSWNLTKKFANDGLEVILTPITFVGGVTVLAVNTVASPAIAFFAKGGRLFINKGTTFQIKLIEDTSVRL